MQGCIKLCRGERLWFLGLFYPLTVGYLNSLTPPPAHKLLYTPSDFLQKFEHLPKTKLNTTDLKNLLTLNNVKKFKFKTLSSLSTMIQRLLPNKRNQLEKRALKQKFEN